MAAICHTERVGAIRSHPSGSDGNTLLKARQHPVEAPRVPATESDGSRAVARTRSGED